jgi:hypothetical protein
MQAGRECLAAAHVTAPAAGTLLRTLLIPSAPHALTPLRTLTLRIASARRITAQPGRLLSAHTLLAALARSRWRPA